MTQSFSAPSPLAAEVDSESSAPTDVAKDQASQLGHQAADSTQQVAEVAKDQAQNVAGEAGRQAKDLLAQAQSELGEQAGAQQVRVASGLRSLGEELHSMAQNSEQAGPATDLARQAAGRAQDAAQWIEDREPGQLINELRDFARQRPGTFLAIAAGAGLLAGRLTRGVTAAPKETPTVPAPPPPVAAASAGLGNVGHSSTSDDPVDGQL